MWLFPSILLVMGHPFRSKLSNVFSSFSSVGGLAQVGTEENLAAVKEGHVGWLRNGSSALGLVRMVISLPLRFGVCFMGSIIECPMRNDNKRNGLGKDEIKRRDKELPDLWSDVFIVIKETNKSNVIEKKEIVRERKSWEEGRKIERGMKKYKWKERKKEKRKKERKAKYRYRINIFKIQTKTNVWIKKRKNDL